MYKIIGQDGKEYGPITAAQLRQWIAENRVESRTPVFADGAKDWTFVGLLPEFAGLFPAGAPQIPPPIHGTSTAGQTGRTSSLAITGFVCGILSVSLCWCCGGFPFNVLGLIFSIVALSQINDNPQLHGGRGLAIAGIILTAASFLIFLVLLASGHAHVNINNGQF
ncbi:MAG TPA: DUF4190 domain-containing protein [Candidatus Paceibacterota bacterium]|nr:DUF4190 domain-containing protein [Candidatus Paceibacterota bacterium]